jgi:tetrapyrrole methylase family protein/MazG family protein
LAGCIKVVGLGSGNRDGITLGAWDELRQAKRIMLRTEQHPTVDWLREQGLHWRSFDSFYMTYTSFQDVYHAVVESLLEEAREGDDIVYAVPGHPSVAEQTVAMLRARCPEESIALHIIGSESFLDRAFMVLGFDPVEGFQLLDATALHAHQIQPHHHIVITQVYDTSVASDVKLTLMEKYPDDYEVTIGHALGVPGSEQVMQVPLYALDRIEGYGNLSLIYVRRTEREDIHYRSLDKLHEIVAHLRSPQGCPWDREQTHRSLRKYFVEETFEALETIDNDDPIAMQEELGDVLLQIMLHAQIEEESGAFTIHDVIAGLSEKLIRRHPHVFAQLHVNGVEDVLQTWQEIKAQEKKDAGLVSSQSILSDVPTGLPSMVRSVALQKKAAKVGFDWAEPSQISAKIREELHEFEAELRGLVVPGEDQSEPLLDEMGDLLFAVVNLARFLKLDPEEALARTNRKFIRRFEYIEQQLRLRDKTFDQTTIIELEQWWQEAKRS